MNKHFSFKLTIYFVTFLGVAASFSQNFTWINGSNQAGQMGSYGTMGIAAAGNNPGGRDGIASWKDLSGNFWIFGGTGFDHLGNYGILSDLWKYSPSTNQWTFIKGNDLIVQTSVYSPIGVSTPTAQPGGRHSSAAWTDASGNLWLLGGYGFDINGSVGYLNDLWKYDPSINQWTYVNGSNLAFAQAYYGTQAVPASTNTPGARIKAVTWTSNIGDLWLFGGYGNTTSSVTIGSLNDVWRYSITTNEWTWMKGSNIKDQNGIYGTIGTPSSVNSPGSRSSATGWKDSGGDFWLFGGDGCDATTSANTGLLNDLWKYSLSTNEWTWMKGSNTANQNGNYGLQAVNSITNVPGGRSGPVSFQDGVGNFWLFGGEGYPLSGNTAGTLNDLWKYDTGSNVWTWIRGSAIINQAGTYGVLNTPAQSNLPGARTTHVGWVDNSNDLYLFGGYGQPANGSAGDLNDMWKYSNCYISPITMTIVSRDSSICAGESTSLTASGSNNYQWTPILATTPYLVITPSVTTSYTVYTTDTKGCRYQSAFTETVQACTGIEEFQNRDNVPVFYPNPAKGKTNLQLQHPQPNANLSLFDALGRLVLFQGITEEHTQVNLENAGTIYYYRIKNGDQIHAGKIISE